MQQTKGSVFALDLEVLPLCIVAVDGDDVEAVEAGDGVGDDGEILIVSPILTAV